MSTLLKFRLNACPICLVCLICAKIYGKDCSCQPIKLDKKSKKGSGYQISFYSKYFTRTGASIKKVRYDQEFVDWTKNSTKVEIPKNQDIINMCQKCAKNYDQHNQSETIDLTIKDSLESLSSMANTFELSDLYEVTTTDSEINSEKDSELDIINMKESESGAINTKEPFKSKI